MPDVINPLIYSHYAAVVLSSSDYYAFGSPMPNRGFKGTDDYKFGFNGKLDDKETGWQDYGERMYNPKLNRFFSVDPIFRQYPELTPQWKQVLFHNPNIGNTVVPLIIQTKKEC